MHPSVHLPPTEAELTRRPGYWSESPGSRKGRGELIVRACPMCGSGELVRIKRRPVDVLTSLFVPVCRVRCYNFRCQYEGNLRM